MQEAEQKSRLGRGDCPRPSGMLVADLRGTLREASRGFSSSPGVYLLLPAPNRDLQSVWQHPGSHQGAPAEAQERLCTTGCCLCLRSAVTAQHRRDAPRCNLGAKRGSKS